MRPLDKRIHVYINEGLRSFQRELVAHSKNALTTFKIFLLQKQLATKHDTSLLWQRKFKFVQMDIHSFFQWKIIAALNKSCYVLKQHVILLYNACNLEFYIDCSQWEITGRKSILNPQSVVDFVTKMGEEFNIFFSLVKIPNHCGTSDESLHL